MIIISHYCRIAFRGVFTKRYIPIFKPVKLMSDAAPAIFNGLSEVYPMMKQGKCFFHMKRNIRDRHYNDATAEKIFLMDLTSLSKSHSQEHSDRLTIATFLPEL
jgi:hypothetical protein